MSEIQSLVRAAKILNLLGPSRQGVDIGDVTRDVGLERTTSRRYLASMEAIGMLSRSDSGGYGIGPLILRLGAAALGGDPLIERSRPVVSALASRTSNTAVLAVWQRVHAVVILVEVPRDQPIGIAVELGLRLEADSAQGLLFLAYLGDEEERELALQNAVGTAHIRDFLEDVRRKGYVIVTREDGLRVVATPVLVQGKIVATVAIVGTTTCISDSPDEPQIKEVIEAASSVSARSGGTPH